MMERRSFLKTAGALAGSLVANTPPGKAASYPIEHFVLVMMENRSFDHLVGWLPNADGQQAGVMYKDANGVLQSTFPLAPDYTGCDYPDPDHSYQGGRTEYDNGMMDGFLQVQPGSLFPIGYYSETALPFHAALAREYVTCDRYFPSILGPTFPNRIFQHAGQTDRLGDSITPICTLPTIWDHLQGAGVSHKYYFGNVPILGLWGTKYLNISFPHSHFLADCAAGTLPAVSYVDPSFTLLANLAEDDHPQSDVRNGDAFLSEVFAAVTQSPNWPNTALIINFDEWGGFFDHVTPPWALAPNNVDPDLMDGKALLGIRVPCIIVSPWTKGQPNDPAVSHTVFDHTSVLKLIESVWNVAPLAARETSNDVGNLLEVFDFGSSNLAVPVMPPARRVIPSQFCTSSILGNAGHESSFQEIINSGILRGWPGF
ncbi:MAG: alkaline phosphatase family protein [Acidobacteriia bacterium]|nr:alkaline phosphatase family protein [Terriglobia bacterium]